MVNFEKADTTALSGDFFTKLNKEWMLVTAGKENAFNTMTASWGGIGVLWNKNVCFVFIRKSRYTLEFIDRNDRFSLSFFNGEMMKELVYCGRNSGRDVDKIKETGLSPVFDDDITYFEQASIVLKCKKLYKQTMTAESFIDKTIIDKCYADDDWHEVFVAEIEEVLVRK